MLGQDGVQSVEAADSSSAPGTSIGEHIALGSLPFPILIAPGVSAGQLFLGQSLSVCVVMTIDILPLVV